MSSGPLAVFTPSVVDVEVLEKLFVGRAGVLDDLVQRAHEAATTGTLAHRMTIGARGAGKTHLMTLAAARIGALEERVQVAWLSEDPWAISDYEDLLREILDALEIAPEYDEVGYPSVEQLEAQLTQVGREGGVVVVIAENFDQILQRIEVQGQRRLRALIENDRALLLLVTTTKLTRATQNQDAPFYEFFSTFELQPFTVDEALEMVTRVRGHLGDQATVDRLQEPSARMRFEAIDALAGGQPRMWSLLSGALDVDGIDDLVTLLLTKFDDLTPYYQEQLGRLSPAEAKAVRIFARLDRAVSVKLLAAEMKVSEQSAAKTVSTLRLAGWIKAVETQFAHLLDRRMTYYELAEPLARVAFQLKETRNGGPIPMVVSFMSAWFTDEELSARLGVATWPVLHLEAAERDPLRAVHRFALRLGGTGGSSVPNAVLSAVDDSLAGLAADDGEGFFGLPSALRRLLASEIARQDLDEVWLRCLELAPPTDDWIRRSERAIRYIGRDSRLRATFDHGGRLLNAGRFEQGSAFLEQALAGEGSQAGTADELRLRCASAVAMTLAGSPDEAIAVLTDAIELWDAMGDEHNSEQRLARRSLAQAYLVAERPADVLSCLETLDLRGRDPDDEDGNFRDRHMKAAATLALGDGITALQILEPALEELTERRGHGDSVVLEGSLLLAGILWILESRDRALELLRRTVNTYEQMHGVAHPLTAQSASLLAQMEAQVPEGARQVRGLFD